MEKVLQVLTSRPGLATKIFLSDPGHIISFDKCPVYSNISQCNHSIKH